MNTQKTPSGMLQEYVRAVHDFLIQPLMKMQTRFSFQSQISQSKRFQEVETKLRDYLSACRLLQNNFSLQDSVLDALGKIQAARKTAVMKEFFEKGKEPSTQDGEDIKTALAPYLDLIKPAEEIRRLQTTMMNQGKLLKLGLPYEEITTALNEVAVHTAKMPVTLIEGMQGFSERLDQVA